MPGIYGHICQLSKLYGKITNNYQIYKATYNKNILSIWSAVFFFASCLSANFISCVLVYQVYKSCPQKSDLMIVFLETSKIFILKYSCVLYVYICSFSSASYGSCVRVDGVMTKSSHTEQPVEVKADTVHVFGPCDKIVCNSWRFLNMLLCHFIRCFTVLLGRLTDWEITKKWEMYVLLTIWNPAKPRTAHIHLRYNSLLVPTISCLGNVMSCFINFWKRNFCNNFLTK